LSDRATTISAANEDRPGLKQRLQAVVCDAHDDLLKPLADAVADLNFEVTRDPEPGLVMMQTRDSFGTRFYLGEVLVTQAEVRRGDCRGHGCCMGENAEAALVLACLEALDAAKDASDCGRLEPLVEAVEAAVQSRRRQRELLTATTRVDFRSMAEE
jgi:phosphonate C-P lyase system protein PhnG